MTTKTDPEGIDQLCASLCKVMAEIGNVPKTGRNRAQGYDFMSDVDLLTKCQPAMAAAGLALVPVATDYRATEHGKTKSGSTAWRSDVTVTYRLLHTSGQAMTVQTPGCGIDVQDKGVYKAMTGALKYALCQSLLIPRGEDAENDGPSVTPQQRGRPSQSNGGQQGQQQGQQQGPRFTKRKTQGGSTIITRACPRCGRDVWDNRGREKSERSPQFSCTDRECDGAVWEFASDGMVTPEYLYITQQLGEAPGYEDNQQNRGSQPEQPPPGEYPHTDEDIPF